MKSYLCVPCDHRFESDERRPRCPKCMRIHDVREVTATSQKPKSKVALWAALAIALVGGGAAVVLLLQHEEPKQSEQSPTRPMEVNDLAETLAKTGADVEGLADLLEADAALASWAKDTASGSSQEDKAAALIAALRGNSGGNFAVMELFEPRSDQVMSASAAFEAWKTAQRKPLYPLEVALIATAALRALEVPAFVAEIARFDDAKAPLDPSGCLGYYAIALQEPNGRYHILDAYGGRETQPQDDHVTVLSDLHVVASVLGTRALTRLSNQKEPDRALHEVEAALALFPSSPILRSVHAVALAANGGMAQGEEAARAALQLRSDAPRYNNLATYLLESGDADGAQKAASHALSLAPDYAAAHLTLASVLLARGKDEEARAEITSAEKLAPDLPGLYLAYAQYHAAQGQLEMAIDYAEREVERRPDQPQVYLSLGRLYLATDRAEDAKRCALKVLSLTPESRLEQMRKVIAAVLGEEMLQ